MGCLLEKRSTGSLAVPPRAVFLSAAYVYLLLLSLAYARRPIAPRKASTRLRCL